MQKFWGVIEVYYGIVQVVTGIFFYYRVYSVFLSFIKKLSFYFGRQS